MPRETAEAFAVRLKYEFSGELISIVKAIRARDRETAEEVRDRCAIETYNAYIDGNNENQKAAMMASNNIRALPLDPPAETWTLEKKLNARLKELDDTGRSEPHIRGSGQVGPGMQLGAARLYCPNCGKVVSL